MPVAVAVAGLAGMGAGAAFGLNLPAPRCCLIRCCCRRRWCRWTSRWCRWTSRWCRWTSRWCRWTSRWCRWTSRWCRWTSRWCRWTSRSGRARPAAGAGCRCGRTANRTVAQIVAGARRCRLRWRRRGPWILFFAAGSGGAAVAGAAVGRATASGAARSRGLGGGRRLRRRRRLAGRRVADRDSDLARPRAARVRRAGLTRRGRRRLRRVASRSRDGPKREGRRGRAPHRRGRGPARAVRAGALGRGDQHLAPALQPREGERVSGQREVADQRKREGREGGQGRDRSNSGSIDEIRRANATRNREGIFEE